MTERDALGRGRDSFANRAWTDADKNLSLADSESPLSADDLERLAVTARMLGKDSEAAELWQRAHQQALQDGDVPRAVRYAFWLGFGLMNTGEFARGSGWLTRGQRMLEEAGLDCVERGYLLLPMAIGTMEEDPAASFEMFAGVSEIASRFSDQSLGSMARVGRGRTLIRLGQPAQGLPILDDAMVAVTAGEVHPMVVGDLYCSVIEACWEIFDVARAQEWTKVLSAWCDSQPDLVPFRGQCRVHRSQILQLHGSWQEAMAEAELAYALFADPPGQPAIGLALYQRGEMYRLLGEFKKAEDDYRSTDEIGSSPHPGFAQLRMLQGRPDAATAAIQRCLAESSDRVLRTKVLPGAVEILLAAGDAQRARIASDEFQEIAASFDAPFMRATAERARGAVLLAEQNIDAALLALRESRANWHSLDAPFEVACTRMLVAAACRALGDDDGAQIELEAARRTFEQLGATPFIANVHQLSGSDPRADATGLTGRELEVLRLVAGGASNRAIAEKLVLSEKTVARHISNIFTKLGLSSRSAATAYAYEHHLV